MSEYRRFDPYAELARIRAGAAVIIDFANERLSRPYPPAIARDPYPGEIAVAVRPRGTDWGVSLVAWNGERWRTGSWLAGPFSDHIDACMAARRCANERGIRRAE